ncbi:MAG: DUF3786 domain-containing protein [Treponema sp.]|jgi:hypothetical protein|nr:DUF3786 domain-containing protein [Treponema sp.]
MEKGYEKTYQWVKGLLKQCDFSDSAKRLGLKQVAEHTVLLDFFDRTYQITKDAIELIEQKTAWPVDSEEYEYNLKSVLGYYVLSDANIEPAYEYSVLWHFSGGVFRESSSWLSMLNNTFSETFGNRYEPFKAIMDTYGMDYEEGSRSGKYIWNYRLLPKLPIKWVFYEGDEEYPSKLQILYDNHALKIFNFEQLSVLHGSIFTLLVALGKNQRSTGTRTIDGSVI